ncbi:hypothetical protein D3C73_1200710 [compost metagenome]
MGEFTGQFDLVAGTKMQIQPQAEQRHQDRRQQRQRFAQARNPGSVCTLGVGQQFTGGLGATAVHLRAVENTFFLLSLQLGHALLIQRDVEGSAIFFKLGTTATKNGNQQKTQGHQEQQTCGEPEINHSWFYPTGGRDAHAHQRKARRGCRRVVRDDGGR